SRLIICFTADWFFFYLGGIDMSLIKYIEQLERQLAEQIANKERVEQETAEACAKVYLNTYDLTDIADDIRSGAWKEYK
ncbi:MAG: hypothetical protein ABFC42_09115, partial [Sulfuricella sp.]